MIKNSDNFIFVMVSAIDLLALSSRTGIAHASYSFKMDSRE
jgi:hypothetical protein